MKHDSFTRSSKEQRAFSLVEVVIALGIVAFAIVVVIGLFSGMMAQSGDNAERRTLVESADALRTYLKKQDFSTVFNWVKDDQRDKRLIFVCYRADDSGQPSMTGRHVISEWIDPATVSTADITRMDNSRQGSWIATRLEVSPSNPGGAATATGTANAYAASSLFVLASLNSVAGPNETQATGAALKTTLALPKKTP